MINKKVFLTIIILSLLSIAACESTSRKIRDLELPPVDLSTIQDSVYTGQYSHHNTLYKVEVTLENHRITEINVLSSEGDEYDIKALDVLDRVMEEQSLNVDAVTGATTSSKLYLICIYNALTGEEITLEYNNSF